MAIEKKYSTIVKNHRDVSRGSTLSQVAADAEKAYIIRVLKLTKGNKTKAANILGISRKTLWEKVKTYHIDF